MGAGFGELQLLKQVSGGGSAGPAKPGPPRVTPWDAEGMQGPDPAHLWLQD